MEVNAPAGLLGKSVLRPSIQKTLPTVGAGDNNGIPTYDNYRPKDTRTKWERLKDDIYNPREGTFLGRNRNKWGVFGLFYLVFYTGLAILCSLCYMGLMYTIDEHRPTYTMESSIIGTNPGMGFRPISDASNPNELNLIKYDSKNGTHTDKWIRSIDDFLEKYKDKNKLPNGGRNQMICSYNSPPQPGKVCAFDVSQLGPCAPGGKYGYDQASPCIFVKLNRIFDWVPKPYADAKSLPDNMPEDLKNHIRSSSELKAVWVSCKGESKKDQENLKTIEYWPKTRSFPSYYYPFANQKEYLSPIVAIKLLRPTRNVTIGIECRSWATNIKYATERGEKTGAVHFDLFIDDPYVVFNDKETTL